MKIVLKTVLVLLFFACCAAADEEKVTVPKSMLTKDQIEKLNGKDVRENVSAWAGVGKEVGEAVNASMQAITVQSNNFAHTGVGKVTIALVVWRILGDQLIHIFGGLLELLVFLPIWVWSFRKTCLDHMVKGDAKSPASWKFVEYDRGSYDVTVRGYHGIAAIIFTVVWLFTTFSY